MIYCEGSRKNPHEEIIFDNGRCPLCEALNEIEQLKEHAERLEEDGKI